MKPITLPITCGNILRILFGSLVALLWYGALIVDPFWVHKIGTIGDMPDYWGRFALFMVILWMGGWLAIEGAGRGWRFPIRCKCDKE